MMDPLRALIVEDSVDDAELLVRELRRGGYDPSYARVETAEAMMAALSTRTWDIVFSDFTMPHFNAFGALDELRKSGQDIPFIVTSGTVGEDRAVALMKAGAHDYVLKDNLTRLVPAVERELREAHMRAERREAEQALRDAEMRYRLLFEQSPDGIVLVDLDTGKIIEANGRAAQQLGYTRDEFAALKITDYEVLESPEETAQRMETIRREGRDDFNTLQRTKSGEIRNVRVTVQTLEWGGRVVFYAILRDITERMQRQAQVRLQSAALNAAADAIAITDRDGTLEWVNPAFTALTGYSAEEAIGKNPRELVKSGVHDRIFYQDLWHTILSGRVWNGELTNRRKDGTLYPEEQTISPVRDVYGEISHFIAVGRDITEQKLLGSAREEARTAEIFRAVAEQANEAKSAFLSQMSHELRTPMNAILGFTELLKERAGPRLQGREIQYIGHVQEAGQHLLSLINDVLDLSQVEAGKMELHAETIRLDRLLEPVLASTELAAAGQELDFTVEALPDLVVWLDAGRVRQILLNLLSNAVKFTPAGGRVSLRVLPEDSDLAIVVADTGIGIPADRQHRVFGAFERLHEDRATIGGTGIGLALTKDLVELQHGEIGFESTEGAGTTFHVRLPGVVRGQTGGHRLLVLEDEIASARLLIEHAADVGLECEIVATVAAALAAIHRDRPSAVVVDLRLEGERGERLLEALKTDPALAGIPALVVSIEDDTGVSRQLGADDHLTKPVDRRRLNSWLRQIAAREGQTDANPPR